jgi:hypothetical protein
MTVCCWAEPFSTLVTCKHGRALRHPALRKLFQLEVSLGRRTPHAQRGLEQERLA